MEKIKNKSAPCNEDMKKLFLFPGLTESILEGVHFSGGNMNGDRSNLEYKYRFNLTAPVAEDMLVANIERSSLLKLQMKKFEDGFISRHFCISEANSFLVEVLINNKEMNLALSVYILPLPYSWKALDYYKILPADMDKGWQEQYKDSGEEYNEIEELWDNNKTTSAKGLMI